VFGVGKHHSDIIGQKKKEISHQSQKRLTLEKQSNALAKRLLKK